MSFISISTDSLWVSGDALIHDFLHYWETPFFTSAKQTNVTGKEVFKWIVKVFELHTRFSEWTTWCAQNKHVFNSTFLPEIHKIFAMWQATDVVHVEQVLLMFFPSPKPITLALKSLKRNIFFSFSSTAFFPSIYWSLVCLAAFLIHFLRISVEDFSALPTVGRRNCMLQFFECGWMLLIYEQIWNRFEGILQLFKRMSQLFERMLIIC